MINEVRKSGKGEVYNVGGHTECTNNQIGDIIVEQLAAGQTIIIDGEEGRITNNGADAFGSVDLWKFPAITQQQTALKFSNADAVVRIRYKPMWI